MDLAVLGVLPQRVLAEVQRFQLLLLAHHGVVLQHGLAPVAFLHVPHQRRGNRLQASGGRTGQLLLLTQRALGGLAAAPDRQPQHAVEELLHLRRRVEGELGAGAGDLGRAALVQHLLAEVMQRLIGWALPLAGTKILPGGVQQVRKVRQLREPAVCLDVIQGPFVPLLQVLLGQLLQRRCPAVQ